MNKLIVVALLLITPVGMVTAQKVIYSTLLLDDDGTCASSIQEQMDIETFSWSSFAFPIGVGQVSDSLAPMNNIEYGVNNICDFDQNTAWVAQLKSNEDAWVQFRFDDENNQPFIYADTYKFSGICYICNGYCKSIKLWEANSRVKSMDVYLNDNKICSVALLDTWKFQTFDLSSFFKNRRDSKYLDAPYEIKSGYKLSFHITELYNGSKYNEFAISEFLCKGGSH